MSWPLKPVSLTPRERVPPGQALTTKFPVLHVDDRLHLLRTFASTTNRGSGKSAATAIPRTPGRMTATAFKGNATECQPRRVRLLA